MALPVKSRFPNGTILAGFSPDPSSSIGVLHEIIGTSIVNGFAHGAGSVVATFDREACLWVVDCSAHVETFEILAGFDEAAPLDLFLEYRAATAIAQRARRESTVLRRRHRRGGLRWRTMVVYDLGEICVGADDDDPMTLGNFAALCAHMITHAVGSGGQTIRFDLLPKAAKLIVGDDGRTDDPIRSRDDRFEDFRGRNVGSICVNFCIQPYAEA